jgi:multidrug efflux pump subunit AcrA (membrane-fusion protein)
VLPAIDAARGTATVHLELRCEKPDACRPDQTVTAQIITGTVPGALVAPQRFLTFADGGAAVFVLRNGRAVRTPVTAQDAGNGFFMLTTGCRDSDTLLSAPSLNDGVRVRLISK